MNTRSGLVLFLALVVLDGAVRKWLLPGWEEVVYIAKDFVLLALVGGYLSQYGMRAPRGLENTPLFGWMGLYAGVVALQALNPWLPGLTLGLFGFKTYVLYAALSFIVPAAFRDVDELAKTLRYLLPPVILVLAFGVVQFYLPVDHVLNRYVRGAGQDVATFGLVHKVRITSTFSYVSGMTVFVFFSLCLGLALLAAGRWRLRDNKLACACLVAAIVVSPMTGARWIFYMLVLYLPLFLFGMFRTGMLETRYALRIVLLSFLVAAAVSRWSLEALESFEYRRQSTTDATSRVESLFMDPVDYLPEAGLLGYGAGATHQAATALFPEAERYGWLPVATFENEPGRIMLELGAFGFAVAFGLRIYLCWLAWRAMVNGGTRSEKALAGAALVFLVAHVISPIVFNVTAGALYWLCVGMVMTIVRDQHLRSAALPLAPRGSMLPRPMHVPR